MNIKRISAIVCTLTMLVTSCLMTVRAAELPKPWEVITYEKANGRVDYSGEQFTMNTNGANVWNRQDEFTFMAQKQSFLHDESSILTMSVTIHSIEGHKDMNAAIGLMMRNTNSAGSRNVHWRVLPDGQTRFTYRTVDDDASRNFSGPKLSFPAEIRLVRQADYFTAYYKQEGEWKIHTYVVVPMDTEMYVGIGGFSLDNSSPITAVFSQLQMDNVDNYIAPTGDYVDSEPITDDLLVRENFEDGSLTNVPVAPNNPIWEGVKFANIVKESDGNKAWFRNRINGTVHTGDVGWTDYKASMDIKFDPQSKGTNKAQIIVRARDTVFYGKFFYAAGLYNNSKLILEKAFGITQNSTRITEVDIGNYLDGKYRNVSIEVMDNKIKVYLDGELKIEHTDEKDFILKGGIGIRTEEAEVFLDNIVVTKLEDSLGGDYDNAAGGGFDSPTPPWANKYGY